MDAELRGVVRPVGEFCSSIDYQYQLLQCSVDLQKIIHLGLTFTNENGEYPSGINTWQFNFRFSLMTICKKFELVPGEQFNEVVFHTTARKVSGHIYPANGQFPAVRDWTEKPLRQADLSAL